MKPSIHSHCRFELYLFIKKNLKISLLLLIFFGSFITSVYSDEVSFYIPEEHEKFPLIDSLYQLIDETKQTMTEKENSFIKEETVREDAWEIKKRYCNYLLEHNIKDTAAVLGFYKTALNHYDVKKQYFKTLLSALEGDIRAKCFIFWKGAREEYSKIRGFIAELEIEEGTVNAIQYDTAAPVDMTLDIKEPTVSDVLGLEDVGDDDPFAGTEAPLAEVDRGESTPADTLSAQAGEEEASASKLEGMTLKKSDILADIDADPEPETQDEKGSAISSFQEDMLKALSAKKSVNEEPEEQKEPEEDSGPGSPEE